MKAWAWALILLSLCGKLAKNLLPRGEKSPLHAPLRFLLSLCLVIVIFSPFAVGNGNDLINTQFFSLQTEEDVDGDTLILEQIGRTMKKSVDTAFPKSNYSLEIYTDDGGVPALVKVICENRDDAEKIADFIHRNYGLEAEAN